MGHSPSRADVGIGTVIAGTYTLESLLGRGGMGEVYLATHARLPGKQVAVKLLHAELSTDEVVARFKREAQIASQLGHPNIVEVDDYNVTPEGVPYLILELLRGESLAERLRAGPLSVAATFAVLRQIGSALAVAHRAGIVHRDLKPQNIFLVRPELEGHTAEIVKVLDFGISKILGSETVKTQETSLLGTPQYMAPEQALSKHSAVDERTDEFALGVIAYEMLCGVPPFTGASIPEVVFQVAYSEAPSLATRAPHVPAPVVAAIERAMAKAQADRFATVSDFIEAATGLALSASGRGQPSRPPPSAPAVEPGLAATVDSGQRERDAARLGSERTHVPAAPFANGSSPGLAPRGTAAAPDVSPLASTMESGSGAPATEPVVVAHPRRGRRRVGVGIGIVIVIALAAITGAMAMHGRRSRGAHRVAMTEVSPPMPSPRPAPRPQPAVVPQDAGVVIATVVDAGPAADAAGSGAATRPTRPVKPVTPVAPESGAGGTVAATESDFVKARMAAASSAMQLEHWESAITEATKALHTDGIGRAATITAYRILAQAACAKHDRGAGNFAERRLVEVGGGKMLPRVKRFCAPFEK